jgi:Zn-dependent metalloprotease
MKGLGAMGRLMTLRLLLATATAAGLGLAAPAAASTVPCDGPVRTGATGAPELLTDCGGIDPSLDADQLADRALDRLGPSLGVRASQFDVIDASRDPAGRVVRVQQRIGGVPVFGGQIAIRVGGGTLSWVRSGATSARPPSLTPSVTAAEALSAADVATGRGDLRLAPTTDLVVYPTGDASILAWQVVLPTSAPADWTVIVDAATGRVITTWNAIQENNSASIFDPNPIQTAGTYTGFADAGDANSGKLTNNRITGFALTHLGPGRKLKGDFADLTGTGITGSTLPYTPGTARSPTRDYDYKRADDRFEEASVYSAITRAQSLIQNLGFTDANNRSIPIDVHYYSSDNSFYSSSDHALHFGDGGVDDAEDSDIVLHEYGHSIQDNQVPGYGPGFNTEQRAIGEGFGDFLAGIYYFNHGKPSYLATRKYCIGDWDAVSYNPFGPTNPGSGCLRWIDGTNENNGADIGAYSGTPSEEHNDGRFWSAAMTCIFEGLGGDVPARNKVFKLVIAHNAMLVPTAANTAFEDSVKALRVADQQMFAGVNRSLINRCSRERGLIG